MGRSWDELLEDRATLNDIDRKAIDYFLRKAIEAHRINPELKDEDTRTVLENLKLIDNNGVLTNAAILLFGKAPLRFFPGVEFRIGRFGIDESDLIFQDVVNGNIIQMADKVVTLLRSKYLISPIHYEGMQRLEPLEIPENALREMLYNSIVHKRYAGVHIQMWIFNNHIELWNEGKLPDELTIDALKGKHSSHPRNILLASVFYKAGFIETWGRGISKICNAFKAIGIEEPVFKQSEGGMLITFKRNYPTMTNEKSHSRANDPINDPIKLSSVDINVLHILSTNTKLTYNTLAEALSSSSATAKRSLQNLKAYGYITRQGSNKAGYWQLTEKGKIFIIKEQRL